MLVGAGGHAKVVIEALRSSGEEPAACLDADSSLWGASLDGVRIEGGDDLLSRYAPALYGLVLGVGLPRPGPGRRALFESLRAKGYSFPPVLAASAAVSRAASVSEGAQILTRAVVHPGAVVGAGAIVNTAAVVEHDVRVGDHVHVAPGAVLCGGVELGPDAFVGAGAVVLPGVKIGAGALVAAGVTVRADVPPGGRVSP